MCECLRREDGTWHVDECCAHVMDEYHAGVGMQRSVVVDRIDGLMAMIQQLAGIEKPPAANGWIRCSERMPEAHTTVLAIDTGECFYVASHDGDDIWWDDEDWQLFNVVAWQPLPEPYRGEP